MLKRTKYGNNKDVKLLIIFLLLVLEVKRVSFIPKFIYRGFCFAN